MSVFDNIEYDNHEQVLFCRASIFAFGVALRILQSNEYTSKEFNVPVKKLFLNAGPDAMNIPCISSSVLS